MDKSEIGIKKLELLKDYLVGHSYFGDVQQAICNDTLLCAAKTIRPTLVITDKKVLDGATDTMQRISADEFLRAFEPLASIRHPNIVLCLGIHYEPENNLPPVIVMELLDQNLTQYLESQQQPLTYETEFHLTCDVAQGLAFLHCNTIVHGNLSSNNILVQRGSVAKIADFGMAEIFKDTRTLRHKEHPFSHLYLPVNLNATDPKFGFKIDVYAFGVLMLQILTCEHPEPDRNAPTGSIFNSSQETAARKNHWSLIDKENPLLQVALKCLEDKSSKRPDFTGICKDLASVMNKPFTKKVVTLDDSKEKNEPDKVASIDYEDITEEFVIIEIAPPLAEPKPDILPDTNHDVPQAQLKPNPAAKVKTKKLHTWNLKNPSCPHVLSRSTDAVYDGTFIYLLCGPDKRTLLRFGPICDSPWGEIISGDAPATWSSLEPAEYAHSSLAVIGPSLVTIGGCNKWKWPTNKFFVNSDGKWLEAEYSMPTSRYSVTVTHWKSFIVIVGGYGDGQKPLSTVEILDRDENQWFIGSSLPVPASCLSGCACGEEVWVAGSDSSKAFMTSLEALGTSAKKASTLLYGKPVPKGAWAYASLPVFDTTLVAIEDSLYAIGGKCSSSSQPTKAVYEYSHKKHEWYIVGHMKEPRSNCLAVAISTKKEILVAGGISESGSELSSIEVAHIRAALDAKL